MEPSFLKDINGLSHGHHRLNSNTDFVEIWYETPLILISFEVSLTHFRELVIIEHAFSSPTYNLSGVQTVVRLFAIVHRKIVTWSPSKIGHLRADIPTRFRACEAIRREFDP